ncbi:hypothetical protein K4F52_005965 [Lecanicillium sp. MT-2017a]|nr:hypothetical protein K4F52_005965 [Lecanicillium sp. MT-2017a]
MPQSLRSILGSSNRVRKPSRPTTPRKANSTGTASPSPRKSRPSKKKTEDDDDDAPFQERLADVGISKLLSEELTLRDVVQAMRYIRNHMFTPVPETGLKSTRIAELLNYRATLPPVVSPGHLNAVLSSPTKVEREIVELLGKGVLRKVRVERRGGAGEALIEMAGLEDMLRHSSSGLQPATRAAYLAFLRANPTAQTLARDTLTDEQTDELVRAGFLTSSTRATPGTTLHVRPEDRTTLTSIQRVSRAASGTVSAVGGQNAIHLSGGGGGARTLTHSSSQLGEASDYRVSVPGHGRHLKLAEGVVDWVREALGRTKWGEGTESWLRERFEGGSGGGLYGTRWKEFWGVEWEWVVGEAVGVGAVEVFETGSVGRGVRALGG